MTMKNFSIVFVSMLVLSFALAGCSGQEDMSKTSTTAIDMEKRMRDIIAAYSAHDVEKIYSPLLRMTYLSRKCDWRQLHLPSLSEVWRAPPQRPKDPHPGLRTTFARRCLGAKPGLPRLC